MMTHHIITYTTISCLNKGRTQHVEGEGVGEGFALVVVVAPAHQFGPLVPPPQGLQLQRVPR